MPEYITQCEEEFGFTSVGLATDQTLRNKAVAALDAIEVGDQAWTFETTTAAGAVGMDDFTISVKRASYSEQEQSKFVGEVGTMMDMIKELQAENAMLVKAVQELQDGTPPAVDLNTGKDETPTNGLQSGIFEQNFGDDEERALKASLAMSSISFSFWFLALGFMLTRLCMGGGHNAEMHTKDPIGVEHAAW